MIRKLILLSLVFLLLSCNSDDDNSNPINCTEIFVFGLKVTVKEAATNAIVTEGLTLTARDGSYEEQLIRAESSDFFIGAGEREGTYVIKITSNDYQTYTSISVLVEKTEDDCHVITEALEYALQPN